MDTRDAGRLGGKAGRGEAKRRGDSAYYSTLRKPFNRINRLDYERLLTGRHPQGAEYGGPPERVEATGRARCRNCGNRIGKGLPAIRWAHDFNGSGSFTAMVCYVHAQDCGHRD